MNYGTLLTILQNAKVNVFCTNKILELTVHQIKFITIHHNVEELKKN